MHVQGIMYLIYGIILVVTFVGIIVFYYSRKRKKTIEDPKYKMLQDDD